MRICGLLCEDLMVTLKNPELIKLTEGKAFAAYSMPGSTDHWLIHGQAQRTLPAEGGFIIQTFENSDEPPFVIIPDTYLENVRFSFTPVSENTVQETAKDDYLDYVNDTIDAIRSGHFLKVVMSRRKVVFKEEECAGELFVALKEKYPNAFVFMYHLPGEGTWCGASPEILLEDTHSKTVTIALAGTQVDRGVSLDQVIWGNKEKEEQHIIERFIEKILVAKGLTYTKEGPVTTRAGSMLHILSTFSITEKNQGLELAAQLHPGPAICGLPMTPALKWIEEKEGDKRNHYCGYLGPWNLSGQRSLFINLRSMQIFRNAYVLYLGGGITEDSIALDEWDETELKAETMLAVIEKLLIT